jgi:hypothetical protein
LDKAAIASAIAQVHNVHVPNDPAVPDSCSLTCIKTAILQRGWFEYAASCTQSDEIHRAARVRRRSARILPMPMQVKEPSHDAT